MQKDNQFLIKYNFENLINYFGVIPELIKFLFNPFWYCKYQLNFQQLTAKNVEQFECKFFRISSAFLISFQFCFQSKVIN
jgi:hypothetical protein